MFDNPFRKKTASERLAENARARFSAAADASHDAGVRAREFGGHTAEGVSSTVKSAGSALGALIPTVAAAFASGRSKTAHGIDEGVDATAHSLTDRIEAAPEQVDHARDWIVDELLPRLQGMVDSTVEAKNQAAYKDGALSSLAGETVKREPKKGGVLMVLGLALIGGAAYFWYTDQQRRQGDPWKRVATSDDPWAGTTERRAVSAAANPGAGMRPSTDAHTAPAVGEKVHLTPSQAAEAREENVDRPVSALATGQRSTTAQPTTTAQPARAAQSIAPAGSGLRAGDSAASTHTEQRTTQRTTVERTPVERTVDRTPATDATVTRTSERTERRFEDPATTGPIATGYAQKADDIAGDNAPTQSIPTVGERLNPVDARPSQNNVDPYGEDAATLRKGDDTTGEKWLRN